ncbi:protein of unknown function [Paraburkholderia kururiensis]
MARAFRSALSPLPSPAVSFIPALTHSSPHGCSIPSRATFVSLAIFPRRFVASKAFNPIM